MTELASLQAGGEQGLNTLLLAPTFDESTTEAHKSLLSTDDPSEMRILFITYRKSPETVITEWRSETDQEPKQIGVISLGDHMRGSQAELQQSSKTDNSVWIETLQDPSDLTGIGIRYNRYLDKWQQEEGPIVVCFDSLTALLQYVDEQTAFKFVHMATSQFQAADAVAHFHLDSEAHSPETEATFRTLFDAVVEVDSGTVTARRS